MTDSSESRLWDLMRGLLMLTLFGGREHDETQWRALLARTGFEPVRIEDRLIQATCR